MLDIIALFYEPKGQFAEEFANIAKINNENNELITQLINLIPEEIKKSKVFNYKVNNELCYEYGESYTDLANNTNATGSNKFPLLKYLYFAIKIAHKYLTNDQLIVFIEKIKNKAKHSAELFEMRPLLKIINNVSIKYEEAGYGIENKKIDWLVTINSQQKVLVEVKYREINFIDNINQMIPQMDEEKAILKVNDPKPENLFKSTENKFKINSSEDILQGVWIFSHLKEKKSLLDEYFKNNINKEKIQFVIISDWEDDCYILSNNESQKNLLKNIFRITESMRLLQ